MCGVWIHLVWVKIRKYLAASNFTEQNCSTTTSLRFFLLCVLARCFLELITEDDKVSFSY